MVHSPRFTIFQPFQGQLKGSALAAQFPISSTALAGVVAAGREPQRGLDIRDLDYTLID